MALQAGLCIKRSELARCRCVRVRQSSRKWVRRLIRGCWFQRIRRVRGPAQLRTCLGIQRVFQRLRRGCVRMHKRHRGVGLRRSTGWFMSPLSQSNWTKRRATRHSSLCESIGIHNHDSFGTSVRGEAFGLTGVRGCAKGAWLRNARRVPTRCPERKHER